MKAAAERTTAVALWAASLAPLWAWWGRRLGDPMDLDVAAWAALAVLVVVLWRGAPRSAIRPSVSSIAIAAAGLAAFHVLRGFVPYTACGAAAILCGIPLLLPTGTSPAPYLALASVGLPTTMILDLFLGLPLRTAATAAAASVLQAVGLPIARTGLEIAVGGTAVFVDVPCAGVHMLGAGALTASALAALFRFGWLKTLALAAAAVVAVVCANIMRIVALTLFAAGGMELSPSAHSAVGCALLVPSMLTVALLAHLMSRRKE